MAVTSPVSFDQTTRHFAGQDRPAVDRFDLDIEAGEFLVLVGPSGCGKSTTLRMLAGLEDVDQGRIFIGDRDVTKVRPKDRDIAMVFQNYALYPHMSVANNLGFALRNEGVSKSEITARVQEAASMLDIDKLLDRKPKSLSGGQRQRVAMGRAIVRKPKVFLMDEPLSNLDAKLRVQTRTQIAELQRRLGTTTVYVTHDQVEAMTMGDRVAVLNDGVLQQAATPREIYDRPANLFVAGFLGSPSMNLLELPVVDGGVVFGDTILAVPRDTLIGLGHSSIIVGIRPENLETAASGLAFQIDVVEELGADAYVYGRSYATTEESVLVARADWRNPPRKGELVHLRPIDHDRIHFFDPASGARLS